MSKGNLRGVKHKAWHQILKEYPAAWNMYVLLIVIPPRNVFPGASQVVVV